MVLVSSLLLLLIVTIMALSIFRSYGVQEKIAGNMREKQRALQSAISTQQYAEWWLINQSGAAQAVANGIANSLAIGCGGVSLTAVTPFGQSTGGQICTSLTAVAAPTSVPYATQVNYLPPNMNITGDTTNYPASSDVYFATPGFSIADLGTVANGRGEVYKIDAYSYGLTAATVAVVESTLQISCLTCNPNSL
jgi:type IV pilus assembly protein PilX